MPRGVCHSHAKQNSFKMHHKIELQHADDRLRAAQEATRAELDELDDAWQKRHTELDQSHLARNDKLSAECDELEARVDALGSLATARLSAARPLGAPCSHRRRPPGRLAARPPSAIDMSRAMTISVYMYVNAYIHIQTMTVPYPLCTRRLFSF